MRYVAIRPTAIVLCTNVKFDLTLVAGLEKNLRFLKKIFKF